jgi:hypothetical protein
MTRYKLCALVLLNLVLLAATRPAHAAQSYDNCTGFIASVPTVISTQGTWCFNKDLSTNIGGGSAITIATNNVTLDCNDFKLGGLAAGTGTDATGIFADTRLNATVRHCNVRGFFVGIQLAGGSASGGHVIEDNRLDGNTAFGITVIGDGSVIRRNRVFDTGGSTFFADARGIQTTDSVDILDNTVSGAIARAAGGGDATGILTTDNLSGRIIGNGVSGLLKDGAGVAKAIRNDTSGRLTIRDNDLVGDASTGSKGMVCASANGSAKNNVISGFATGIDTCSDDGGNTIHP